MDINDLHFVRCTMPETFTLIPRYLFEQINDLGYGEDRVENIYKNGLSILMVPTITDKGVEWIPNPLIHVVIMFDAEHHIKGFLWAEVDLVDKHIFIHALSLDKEYQSNGQQTEKTLFEKVLNITDRPELKPYKIQKKIVMATSRPKAYERFGFKRTKKVLMEINDGQRRQQDEDS